MLPRALLILFTLTLVFLSIVKGPAVAEVASTTQTQIQPPVEVKEPEPVKEEPPPVVEQPAPPALKTETKQPLTLINMPHYSQAPFGVWDALHEETCEEASVLMVAYWLNGKKPSLAAYDEDLKQFVAWQEAHGYGVSVSSQELKTITQQHIGLNLELATVNSADDMINILEQGKPIIFPADGKLLRNPYFRNGGPVYHMLVVIGYDAAKKQFITNDPGTKFGAGYRYSYDTLLGALGNWNGSSVDLSDGTVLVTNQ